MISSNERLAFHRIPTGMMEVINRRWYQGRRQGGFNCIGPLLALKGGGHQL